MYAQLDMISHAYQWEKSQLVKHNVQGSSIGKFVRGQTLTKTVGIQEMGSTLST